MSPHLTRVVALLVGLIAVPAPPALLDLLADYGSGRYDDAVKAAAAIEDLGPMRVRFVQDVPAWIAADVSQMSQRRAVAAAFLLELAHARLETDWARLSDLIEFFCQQLRAGDAREFEMAWQRASVALASRARERIWLLGDYPLLPGQRPPERVQPVENPSPQHLIHALERFPDDPQLRLARIVAWTWGRDGEPVRNVGTGAPSVSARRRASVAEAIDALEALVEDKDVGAEARLRIGQLQFALTDYDDALRAFQAAQSAASPDIRYLAHFLAARTLEAMMRTDAAQREYEEALRILPGAESAALALGSLQFVNDDRAAAVALFQRSFEQPRREDDPGRLAGYGSFMHWPRLRDDLRAKLRP
jgi:tetratricopeptide (TPR) repeat protein